MEAAARQSSPQVVATKRPRRSDLIDIPAAVGMEAAAYVESRSRGAKPQRRGTVHIPSSRRAKKTTFSPLRPSPHLGAKSRAQIRPYLGAKSRAVVSRAQIPSRRGLNESEKQLRAVSRAQIPLRRGLDDDSTKQPLAAQISSWLGCLFDDSNRQGHPNWVGSRARTTKRRRCCAPLHDDADNKNNKRRRRDLASPEVDGWSSSGLIDLPCPPDNNNWRDWANLADGPAGLIAERVLDCDVADYVRFRAVCRPWRQSSSEPRTHSGLDRRFHPWRWTMLREELAAPDRRCFLNTSTGECVKVDIPELHDSLLLAVTPEGLLVLVHKTEHATVCLLNPLTRHLIELPPLTKLLPFEDHHKLLQDYIYFDGEFKAWGSGIANDDSTVVLCFNKLCMIGMAKPGDDSWNLLKYRSDGMITAPLIFEGRFYCVNLNGVMVLETGPDQPPQLKVAAKLSMRASPIADSMHLVNNCGELMLVHRWCGPMTAQNKSGRGYNVYQVDLDTGMLILVKTLGGSAGRAVFMGMLCSLSVSLECFPSGSISADTIYLSFDAGERRQFKVGAYHLVDGTIERTSRNWGGVVPRPHTLADCLSLPYSVKV